VLVLAHWPPQASHWPPPYSTISNLFQLRRIAGSMAFHPPYSSVSAGLKGLTARHCEEARVRWGIILEGCLTCVSHLIQSSPHFGCSLLLIQDSARWLSPFISLPLSALPFFRLPLRFRRYRGLLYKNPSQFAPPFAALKRFVPGALIPPNHGTREESLTLRLPYIRPVSPPRHHAIVQSQLSC